MGDRGNIVIRYDADRNKEVYFYTHWRGMDLPAILQRALLHRQRWDDEAYLARIIFEEMIAGGSNKFTGFGISPHLCDNEHNILVVDVMNQVIAERTEEGIVVRTWSFDEFAKLNLHEHFAEF